MDLRLNLDTIDFDQLAELGRAAIPGLDPDWTDHNAHDPGIMLMELVAWIAEAQIYSLSRMRRDERLAYARLLGVIPRPPAPARTFVWPLGTDEGGQPGLFAEASVGTQTTAVPDTPNPPTFRVSRTVRLTAATLQQVRTETAAGGIVDQTRANGRNGAAYLPFGAAPQPGDRLVLAFQPGPVPASFTTDPLAIGVEMAWPDDPAVDALDGARSLQVSLRDSGGERAVRVVEDATQGLFTSGVVLLDLSGQAPVDPAFELVLRGPAGGFLRTPRVRRIAVNVLPVEQIEAIADEEAPDFGEGLPDQTYRLVRSGLIDPADPRVSLIEPGGVQAWRPVADLSRCGPADRVFAFDRDEGELTFGNGLNGMRPPAGSALRASYSVSLGAGGAAPPNGVWRLRGFADPFGVNPTATAGGRDADTLADLQGLAREKMSAQLASVTSDDLAAAARGASGLAVTRAYEAPPGAAQFPGSRVLVAKATADPGADPLAAPETPQWLSALRARLAPTLPMGQRLRVRAPGYVDVRVAAKLTAELGASVADVQDAAAKELASRLTLDDGQGGGWAFGRGLTATMVSGWLRKLDGVARVDSVQLYRAGVLQDGPLVIGPNQLPRLAPAAGDISVNPPGGGAA